MSIAFFAKGFGNIDWCILSDTSPKEILGAVSCLFITEPLKRLQIDPPKTAQQYPAISAAAQNALFRMYRFVLFC
ncbi:MAG: hypothetical protein JO014_19340 [Metakosakonia sp.]|nr:hypothetical protein [Phytobacter sp.]